jgi:putative transposase
VEQRPSASLRAGFEPAFREKQERQASASAQMTIPYRGTTGDGTYFITASTDKKKSVLQSDRMAGLFIRVLFDYRHQRKYQLHEFVVMPDHFLLLITPLVSLERAVQFIKGGFSFRAGKMFGFRGRIWQTSFFDRRVRDSAEYQKFKEYIHQNPVKRGLIGNSEEYPYSSASGKFTLDPLPQRLKPGSVLGQNAALEALLHP